MSSPSASDYKALYFAEKEERRRAEERQRQAEDAQRRAEERSQRTTFDEYIRFCHTLLSAPLQVENRSRSTKGSLTTPTGKYCPTTLREWTDFPARQAAVYKTVRDALHPAEGSAPRLFSSLDALEDLGRSLCQRPISSEKDLEGVERYGKDRHVGDIVAELCRIPSAREKLRLGHGFRFDSHANALDEETADAPGMDVSKRRMQPDQFCVHRVDGQASTLLITVEYKPPHKLSVETLCAGLRSMDFWQEVVNSQTIPTDDADKLLYNATRLTGAALVQEYHVMIQEGLTYSCLTTGIALVFLHIPEEQPTTLCYYLCVPNKDVQPDDESSFQLPFTAVARLLCLCLMSCRTLPRSNAWRNAARSKLHIWETDFDYARSQVPDEQLHRTPPGSVYIPSSPLESPVEESSRRTRSHARCTPSSGENRQNDSSPSESESDSEPDSTTLGRKRNRSQIASSSPLSQALRTRAAQQDDSGHRQHAVSSFCTQRCLLNLRQGGPLDTNCPNVVHHRQGKETNQHLVNASELVQLLKQQLDSDLDHDCDPFGSCGAYGAPFRIRCKSYGYTVVGKGTTSQLWNVVSREAAVYLILTRAQGSAVPVFLGSLDLEQIYFLHGAGEIRHMLLMAWGGEPLSHEQWKTMSGAIRQSNREIRELGVRHTDLRRENVLWNAELKRMLLIDFDSSELVNKQVVTLKRRGDSSHGLSAKRHRLTIT